MKTAERNGKKLKNAYAALQKTGQGLKFAADSGYKTGYFMAKHPGVKIAKEQIQKNYKVGLLTVAGMGLITLGLVKVLLNLKK